MRHATLIATAVLAALATSPVLAQDELSIVVTGQRNSLSQTSQFYDEAQSAIGLTRRADFFVKPLFVNSDSRDADQRRDEVHAMLRATIEAAERAGIALVAGQYTLQPLTLANYQSLPLSRGNLPDTTRVQLYARLPLAGETPRIAGVDEQIAQFVSSVPVTGRSYIDTGSTSLAVSNPQQYRGAVVRVVAEEANRYAAMFGSGYGVEIRGLEGELFWQQASETEVFLFIEHNFVIRPR